MAQQLILRWVNPTQNTDGSLYSQNDNAGYTLRIDTAPAVSIPLAFGTEFDMGSLALVQSLSSGNHTAALAVVNKDGVQSDFADAASFRLFATPRPPTNLTVG